MWVGGPYREQPIGAPEHLNPPLAGVCDIRTGLQAGLRLVCVCVCWSMCVCTVGGVLSL